MSATGIVHAFDLDERTVKSWWRKAGEQCQRFHEEKVTQQTIDLEHVQMDEIKVKVQEATSGWEWHSWSPPVYG
ncbi:MAG: hypothetical protein H6652_00560 [Ardenticatenaceae bacterium]|nr:hypothetical protein [Ardenticatenaceae bacterium]